MLDIEKLKYIWDKPFLDIVKHLKTTETENYILFYINDGYGWFFEYEKHSNYLYIQYNRVWLILREEIKIPEWDLRKYIKDQMEKKYNLKTLLPSVHHSQTKKIR